MRPRPIIPTDWIGTAFAVFFFDSAVAALGCFGKVYVYERAFARVAHYRAAERAARRLERGLWSACSKPLTGSGGGSGCHPSYTPCLPVVGDLDCDDVRRMGKAPVRVTGSDPYRLDGDGDGWGCE